MNDLKIVVAGTGYVGLSLTVLLAQYNHVVAVDVVPEKVEMINSKESQIQDDYIEKYLVEKKLNLTASNVAPTNIYPSNSVSKRWSRGMA